MIYDFDDYESPISMEFQNFTEKIVKEIVKERDNQILADIQEECQIKIDKFELMRALNYDRDQYKKGFEDAKKKFERPKGKWALKRYDSPLGTLRDVFCSCCGKPKAQDYFEYCSKCGADMREDDEND